MTDQTIIIGSGITGNTAYMIANALPPRDNRLVVHSSRPPLAKRGAIQYSHVSKPLNLKQFDSFFSKNSDIIRNNQAGRGDRSTIISQKENLNYSYEAGIGHNEEESQHRQTKKRIDSANLGQKQPSSNPNRSNSQNNNMKHLIAMSIKSIASGTPQVRDVHSAKSNSNSVTRGGNVYQRFENFERNHSRQQPTSQQRSINNIIPTKQISMNSGDCVSTTRSKSRMQQNSITHQHSFVNTPTNNPIEMKRQNSMIAKPGEKDQAPLVTGQAINPGDISSRQKRMQSLNCNLVLPYVTAQSWVIYDINTKKFIQGKKENYKREVASITKMMTFYTCIRLMDKFNIEPSTVVTASRTASLTNGTSACLREGDQLTLEQLFYGLMLPSGNDAAYCLAEFFGQYLKDNKYQDQPVSSFQFNWSIIRFFLKEMNLHAFKLRMFSSQFDSPHGLANKHNYSTASDISLLAAKCMEIPRFRRVVSTQVYNCQALRASNTKKPTQYNWENTNKLLSTVDGFIGCKTGITEAAGPCFCGGYERGNDKYIVVVLCSKSMEQRWVEVPKIVDWAIKKKRASEEMKDKYLTREDSQAKLVRMI